MNDSNQPDKATALSTRTDSDAYCPTVGIPITVAEGNQGPMLLADAATTWIAERLPAQVALIPLWPVPYNHLFHALWPKVRNLDGLILPPAPQSGDWHALLENRPGTPATLVWSITQEIALAQLATYIGMPILAIGEGAEKWNTALGGKCKPVPEKKRASSPPAQWPQYDLTVVSPGKLALWLKPAARAQFNEEADHPWSLPFTQFPREMELAKGIQGSAMVQNRVGAFVRKDKPFGVGILGRIDLCPDQWQTVALFRAFWQACYASATARLENDAWNTQGDAICATVDRCVKTHLSLLNRVPFSQEQISQEPKAAKSSSSSLTHLPIRKTRVKRPQHPTLTEIRLKKKAREKRPK